MRTKYITKRHAHLIWQKICKILITGIFGIITIAASATTYYVSNSGDDSNSGVNKSDAWRTLEKVNSFVPSPGDQILFKRGDEWVGTLTVRASGLPVKPITYGAYGSGEKPKIYGSEIITGWEHHSGNIYKASATATKINQLFVDNERINSARHPNSGYFDITKVVGAKSFSSNQISGEIDYSGATAVIRTREWAITTKSVVGSSGQTLSVNSEPIYDLNVGEGFVLLDKFEFLDQPGEWYYDDSKGVLYVWSPSGNSPENHSVRASTIDYSVKIDKKHHVRLQNLDLFHSNVDGIFINNSSYINISNCDIILPDARGVNIEAVSSNHITLENNLIDGANYDGIYARGTFNNISDNTIKNIRLFKNLGVSGLGEPMGGRGISLVGGNCTIRYNKIENIGYNGIGFFTAPNTIIENNVIKNVCLTTEDGGGIYCFNTSESDPGCENSVIRGNIIDYAPGNGDGYTTTIRQGCGIYTDDRIHNITIEDNTVTRCSYYGIYLHNNKHITAKNNTIFDNGGGVRVSGDYNATGNTVINNTIVNLAASNYSGEEAMLTVLDSRETTIVDIDENTYVDRNRDKPFKDVKNYSLVSFTNWKQITGQDKNSVFVDAQLADEEKEKLFYNDTKQTVSLNLGNLTFTDVHGNIVSGIVSLPPFSSVILIGKKTELINRSPVISDHTFNIVTPIEKSSFVGKVLAFDQDANQNLFFSIIQGNENGSYDIDHDTGEIFTKQDIAPMPNSTVQLTIRVNDRADFPLFSDAVVSIHLTPGVDIEPPVINSFVVPAEYNDPTVPVSEFTATDDGRITGFGITEHPLPPGEDEWVSSAPTTFFFSGEGDKTLYAWVIDTAGNISTPLIQNTLITFPDTIEIINDVMICAGQEYNGWTQPGFYRQHKPINSDTIQVTITELNIDSGQFVIETVEIKEGENYNGWTESGTYERNLENINGCDSIVKTNLTVLQPVYTTEDVNICENETYLGWGSTGQYTRTLTSALGADSIVTTNLWVNPTYYHEKEIFITEGENYNGWSESGTHTHTYTSISGCDSVVVIELKIHPWTGDPQYSYIEWSREERYKRRSEQNSLNGVARLKSITKVTNNPTIYPNPTNSYVIVDFQSLPDPESQVLLFDNTGRLIQKWQIETNSKKIDIKHLPGGIYYFHINNQTYDIVKKIVKK